MRIALVCSHGPGARPPRGDCGLHRERVDALGAALAVSGAEVSVHRPGRRPPDGAAAAGRPPTAPRQADPGAPDAPAAAARATADLAEALCFGATLGREWARTPPDLVHALCPPALLPAAVGLGPGRGPLVQTVEEVGALGPDGEHARGADPGGLDLPPSGGWLAQGVVDAFVATNSQAVRDLAHAGVEPDAVALVPWGVDPDRFRPATLAADGRADAAGTAGTADVAAGLPDGAGRSPLLLAPAGLHELDGADLLVRALAGIPHARLVLAGGPHRSRLAGDLDARRIRALTEERGVADRVVLLGSVTADELPALLGAADLVLWGGWRQPTGMQPQEPMAAGVPVLATAVGGALDLVAHRLTGVLVAPGRPEAVAVAARRLLADPGMRARYVRSAATAVRLRHGWPQTAARMLAAYESALSGSGRTVRRPGLADRVVPGLGS
jgi:D-inositol-3-phosphate glycosyltransferase